jgi:hypothetical protein
LKKVFYVLKYNTDIMESFGEINERGYLAGFGKRGYTLPKCLLEIGANSLDALDRVVNSAKLKKKLVFDIRRDSINIIDNGIGMNALSAKNMFAMHRENHADHSSRGVSGIGVKPGMSQLSNHTTVTIYTHMINDTFLCITAPWGEIHKEGIYTGKVTARLMSDAEKKDFIDERVLNGMVVKEPHGTTMRFQYSDTLKELISENFVEPILAESVLSDPLDRFGVIFGRDNVEMVYKHFEQSPKVLSMYNYFSGTQVDFYTGYDEVTIEQWSNDKGDRFIWRDGANSYEITRVGRGYSKDPQLMINGLQGYEHAGNFTVKVGLRNDSTIFDVNNPVKITAEKNFGQYNLKHLGEVNDLFLSHNKLVRNNQLIGLIPPEVTITSARGCGKSRLSIEMVQCEVSYNPISSQSNHQDRVMNIQENKNQFNGASLSKTFTRIVKGIKEKKSHEIWEYFSNILKKHGQPVEEDTNDTLMPLPPPAPVSTPTKPSILDVIRVASSKEAPVEEAPVEEAPVEDAPLEEATVEEATVEEATVEEAPVEEAPVEEAPVEEAPVEEAPVEEQHIEPVDVPGYRRGGFTGREFKDRMVTFMNQIDDNILYTSPTQLSLFNALNSSF